MLVPYNRHNDDDYDGGLVILVAYDHPDQGQFYGQEGKKNMGGDDGGGYIFIWHIQYIIWLDTNRSRAITEVTKIEFPF